MDEYLHHCIDLLNENEISIRNNAVQVLSNLCENILRYPEKEKYRKINLNDPNVTQKLFPASGAIECLFEIGFTEGYDCLYLRANASLAKVRTLQKLLPSIDTHESNNPNLDDGCTLSETVELSKELSKGNEFFMNIIGQFHSVMQYENEELQEKARKVIPLIELEIKTMERLRKFQKDIKRFSLNKEVKLHSSVKEEIVSSQELFLMELLQWYKYEFFQWVDSPLCPTCSKECSFESSEFTSDPKCSRIEVHKCSTCDVKVEFPRYTDPEILLLTRSGRCGEWANLFTLLCRSLNYDARLVHDVTDHLWTEVWSVTENRWIHIDPCENIIDQPLMYECGWNKKLSYIIAFSRDEVQDVTWRYTRDQVGVMTRRTKCSEENLLRLFKTLNEKRQNSLGYSLARKHYVTKRRVRELAEMLYFPYAQNKRDDKNYQERTTGSYAWRMERGEVSSKSKIDKGYTWDISKYGKLFNLRYFIVKNVYEVLHSDGTVLEERSDWQEGINYMEGGIFHKTEQDWKMTYLTRAPSAEYGRVRWSFEVKHSDFSIETFDLKAKTEVFHGANISWEVEGFFPSPKENTSVIIPIITSNNFVTDKLKGANKVNLTVKLSGGKGDFAWQHAQLFRESINNIKEASMTIVIKLSEREN